MSKPDTVISFVKRGMAAQKAADEATLDANAERIKQGVAADVQRARATIEPWVDRAFPPRFRVAVTIALLQIAIDWQLNITDDEEFLLKRIHSIFADAQRRRRQ